MDNLDSSSLVVQICDCHGGNMKYGECRACTVLACLLGDKTDKRDTGFTRVTWEGAASLLWC